MATHRPVSVACLKAGCKKLTQLTWKCKARLLLPLHSAVKCLLSSSSSGFHPASDVHTCSWTGTVWRQPEAQLAGVKVTAALKGKGTSDDMYSQESLLELSESSSCSEVAAAGFFDPSPRPINSWPPSSGLMPRTFMCVLRMKTFPPGFLPRFFMLTQELDSVPSRSVS
ncbi:unnamed protein product [Coccothraustes coccothraustes]